MFKKLESNKLKNNSAHSKANLNDFMQDDLKAVNKADKFDIKLQDSNMNKENNSNIHNSKKEVENKQVLEESIHENLTPNIKSNNINSLIDIIEDEKFLKKKREQQFVAKCEFKNGLLDNTNRFKSQKLDSLNDSISKSVKDLHYKTNLELINNNDACKEDETHTEISKDAIAQTKKQIEISKAIKEGKLDPKYYRGKAGYALYLEKSEQDLNNSKYTGSLGPMRINTNIKSINQIDYAMGICKDFKNAGVCGYGDDCIFLHDRGEIKSSWEIDKEIKKKEAKKLELIKKGINPGDYDDYKNKNSDLTITKLKKLEDETTCSICKKEYVNPISTLCNHVFCESCALNYYNNNSKLCFICQKHLKGVFNSASDIKVKVDLKNDMKKRYEENKI